MASSEVREATACKNLLLMFTTLKQPSKRESQSSHRQAIDMLSGTRLLQESIALPLRINVDALRHHSTSKRQFVPRESMRLSELGQCGNAVPRS